MWLWSPGQETWAWTQFSSTSLASPNRNAGPTCSLFRALWLEQDSAAQLTVRPVPMTNHTHSSSKDSKLLSYHVLSSWICLVFVTFTFITQVQQCYWSQWPTPRRGHISEILNWGVFVFLFALPPYLITPSSSHPRDLALWAAGKQPASWALLTPLWTASMAQQCGRRENPCHIYLGKTDKTSRRAHVLFPGHDG